MLKKLPSRVLSENQSSTWPLGKERVSARLGWAGVNRDASGFFSPAALLDNLFEHPVCRIAKLYLHDTTIQFYI